MRFSGGMIFKVIPLHIQVSHKLTIAIYVTKPLIEDFLVPFESFDAFIGVDYYQPRLT
jgi:hypothetical protein